MLLLRMSFFFEIFSLIFLHVTYCEITTYPNVLQKERDRSDQIHNTESIWNLLLLEMGISKCSLFIALGFRHRETQNWIEYTLKSQHTNMQVKEIVSKIDKWEPLKRTAVLKLSENSCIVSLIEIASSRFVDNQKFISAIATKLYFKETDRLILLIKRLAFARTFVQHFEAFASVRNVASITFNTATIQKSYFSILTKCIHCGGNGKPVTFESNIYTTSDMMRLEGKMFPDLSFIRFNGKPFSLSCVPTPTYVSELSEYQPGKWSLTRGATKFVLAHLMTKFNFTINPFPASGVYGLETSNGSWNGVMGDLISGKAEMGQIIGQTYSRYKLVTFTAPVSYLWMTFVTGIPNRHYSWKSIYKPLDTSIWLLVISLSVGIFVLIWSRIKMQESSSYMNNNYKSKICAYLFSALLEQHKKDLSSLSGIRQLTAVWLLSVIIVNTSYRTTLVGMLTIPTMESTPSNFKQLAETNDEEYRITLQNNNGAGQMLFRTTTDPVLRKLKTRMWIEDDAVKCFENSRGNTKHACISWGPVIQYYFDKYLTDRFGRVPLIVAPEKVSFIANSLVLRKDLPFETLFDPVLFTAYAMGLDSKWMEMDKEHVLWVKKQEQIRLGAPEIVYPDIDGKANGKLKSGNLVGTWWILFVGFILADITFVWEHVKNSNTVRRNILATHVKFSRKKTNCIKHWDRKWKKTKL